MRKTMSSSAAALACFLAAGAASAQVPPPPLEPLPPGAPLPPNIVQHPDGRTTVTRTPEQGVDVHAQTPDGAVHAYGCGRVDVDPRATPPSPSAAQRGPCPLPHASPYPYAPPPTYVYPPPPPPPPAAPGLPGLRKQKPKYAPDPGRKGALIASSIIFGLGTATTGAAYIISLGASAACDASEACNVEPSKSALYAMGAILTITPSVPRLVVGDWGKGLLFTALRGGSFAAGTMIDWDDKSHLVPVTFAFLAPLTLGIVDLATTPHREQLEAKKQRAAGGFELHGLGPTVSYDLRGNTIPAVGAIGTF
ncbi:hypothetical protein [Polyangium spumosum]|uniref:Uncharacterized protein n=1 Tax=Polyangium spumosum TaxID=889282 RepID=A0A6N7PGW9_9BACT|nr:hypothetical protein [Polyangium spumosum]MRG91278.1 hypothetical protein [Polyangium spumosum]